MRVAFGDCVFDSETRELLRAGRAVPLAPKAFQLLAVLLTSRPRALSQGELKDALWPKSFVARSSLGRLVAELRAALGDEAGEPRYVRTLHGFGYAFCGPVVGAGEAAASALPGCAWRLIWGTREIDLNPGAHIVGRTPGCAVWIEAPGVSRRHARLVVTASDATLEDLGSKNGTFLGGQRVRGAAPVRDGDEIAIGTALLTVRTYRADRSTETVSRR